MYNENKNIFMNVELIIEIEINSTLKHNNNCYTDID
jgi:hypothetical protein